MGRWKLLPFHVGMCFSFLLFFTIINATLNFVKWLKTTKVRSDKTKHMYTLYQPQNNPITPSDSKGLYHLSKRHVWIIPDFIKKIKTHKFIWGHFPVFMNIIVSYCISDDVTGDILPWWYSEVVTINRHRSLK